MQLRQCVVRALALLLLLDSVQTFMARFGRQAVHNWLRPAGRPVLAKLALRLATHVEGEPRIPSSLSLRLDVYVPRNARNRSALHQTPVRLEKVIDAASKGRVSEAVRLFERVAPSNDKVMQLKQCNILLRALGDCGALSACDHVLQGFDRLGLQPNIVTICTLISRAGTAKKPEAARHYFQLMKTFKIAPDVASFNALGSAYAKSGNVSAALRILPAILQGGLSPTIITFNTLLDACARSGDVKQAEHIFALIANFPIQPTSYTYSSLAHAYTKARDPEGGTRVLRRMVRAGIEPGAVIYTTLIDAYGSAGKLKEAFDLLEEMKSRGLQPTLVTLSTVLTACARGDRLDLAFQLFRTLLPQPGDPSTSAANTITCTSLLACCLKKGDVEAAFSVLHEMCAHNVPFNSVTASVFLAGCAQLQQILTLRLRNRLTSVQQRLPSAAASGVVGSENLSSDHTLTSLFEAVNKVHNLGVVMDAAAYNVLILACAEQGDLDQALQAWSLMQSRGVHHDATTLRSLLLACRASRGEMAQALAVGEEKFSKLSTPTLPADALAYVSLLELHLAVEPEATHKPRVREIVNEMRRKGLGGDPLAVDVMRRLDVY